MIGLLDQGFGVLKVAFHLELAPQDGLPFSGHMLFKFALLRLYVKIHNVCG